MENLYLKKLLFCVVGKLGEGNFKIEKKKNRSISLATFLDLFNFLMNFKPKDLICTVLRYDFKLIAHFQDLGKKLLTL